MCDRMCDEFQKKKEVRSSAVVRSIVQSNLQVAGRHEALLQVRSSHSRPAVALVQLDHVEQLFIGHLDGSFTFSCGRNENVC